MVLDGSGSVYNDTGWYLVSISWHCLVLGGTWSAKGLYACIYWKKWRFGRVLPMPDTQTSEYRATQLVSSIKHKLSHAICHVSFRAFTRKLSQTLQRASVHFFMVLIVLFNASASPELTLRSLLIRKPRHTFT